VAARATALIASGHRVLAVDPFYLGESKPDERPELLAILVAGVGQRPLGLQAGQLMAAARWLAGRYGEQPVTLVAVGPRSSVSALVAAGLEVEAIGGLDERYRLVIPSELCEGLLGESAECILAKERPDAVGTRIILFDLALLADDAAKMQEQQKAEALLATVVDNLRQAGDSMASDTEAELRRAAAEAAKIDEGLQKLGASEPEPKPADQAQKEKTSDQTNGKPQADAGDKSKPQDQKKETKPAGAADDAAKQAAAQPSDKQDAGKEKKQPGVPDDKTKQAAQPSDKKDADKDAKQALTPDDKAKQTAQASDKQDADKEKKQALTPADQAKQAAAQPPATDKKDGKQDDRQADKKDGKPDGKKDGKQETKPDGARDDLAKSPDSQSATDAADNKDKENRKPLSDQEKKDLAESLTYDMQRLAAHLDNRQFVEKKDAETLARRTQDSVALARVLQEENNPKREELAALIRRVRNKLEADYQAQLDSKRLVAAQNEECPPAYRHLVNKYYEVLSQEKK